MAELMTEKMSECGSGRTKTDPGLERPRRGERYRCGKCGMEVQVTSDCRCQDPGMVHFHCCGQELQKL
jgi:hypothetical protein